MLIRFGYDLTFNCPAPVQVLCLLDAHPDHDGQLVSVGPLSLTPTTGVLEFVDTFGNRVTRFTAPAGIARITRDMTIKVDGLPQPIAPFAQPTEVEDMPPIVLAYLYGSRYCDTDRFDDTAWALFGKTEPGWTRVQAVCDYVNSSVHFGYEYARSTRTAYETHEERVGVCRDFAHLAVTFCRCLNIPARYVNGFLGDIGVPPDPSPMDYNAWFEAYIDGRWWIFDARHNVPRIGRITVARGRDAADVAMMTSFGPHTLEAFRVWTEEIPPVPS